MQSWLQHRWTSLYLIVLALGAILLFLYGFFPLKYHTGRDSHMDDLPNFIDGVSIDGQEVYNPGETSVILMVIDGLRYDFVTEEYMPYTGQLLKNKSACIYVSVAEPPTVTMPRIKAMMTGSVSTFADVALNFGAPAVKGDSVLRAAAARGRRSVMYGDDTWLRLFPGLWAEADGTTSFYVTDYTEVDNNVTRHLDKVLTPVDDKKAPPFDFLVLHYLGLDHIGHLEGARSPKIKPKLQEMDEVVKKIFSMMAKWERAGVLLVCGDHGMRDAGGHGGATPAEVLVPLVVAKTGGYQCPYLNGQGPTVAQVDVAPTIAWLLDAPPPGDSTGRVLPSLLPADTRQHLYVLHVLAKHNAAAVQKQLGDATDREFYKQFKRAEQHFGHFLATGQLSAAKIARDFYGGALDEMAKLLSESTVEFDMFAIVAAVILLYALTASLVCVTLYSIQRDPRRPAVPHHLQRSQAGAVVAFIIILLCAAFTLTLACAISETKSNVCSLNPLWMAAFAGVAVTLTVAFFITKASIETNLDLTTLKDMNAIDYLLVLGTLLHPWTFFGTSFIEEEHMTWYFYWNTLMFFALIRTLVVVVLYFSKLCTRATEVQDKPQLERRMTIGISIVPLWIALIALHRYLRTMNQTGDRWLFLPDTADWLNAPENSFYLQAHLVIGTFATSVICLANLKYLQSRLLQSLFTVMVTAVILFYRIATNALDTPFPSMKSWDVFFMLEFFWGLLILQFAVEIINYSGVFRRCRRTPAGDSPGKLGNNEFVYNRPKEKTDDFCERLEMEEPWNGDKVKFNLARSVSHIVLNHVMMIVALLMRPHNVIMIPSVFLTCKLTSICLNHKLLDTTLRRNTDVLDVVSETLAHVWIGYVFFFYQGNSNSLASVDLGSGYVGLQQYCPVRVALRMGLHAYAGPTLAGCTLICNIAARTASRPHYLQTLWQATNILALQRVYSLSVYAVVATVFRHHLFVWTVFSPKLLYDFVGTVFTVQALVTIAEIVMVTQLTSWLARALTLQRLW